MSDRAPVTPRGASDRAPDYRARWLSSLATDSHTEVPMYRDDDIRPDVTREEEIAGEVEIHERALFHMPSLRRQLLRAIPEARLPTPTEARQYRRTGTDAA